MKTDFLLITSPDILRVRLDKFLDSNLPDLSRSRIQELIKSGLVKVNGIVITKASSKLFENDKIEVSIPQAKKNSITPQDIPLTIYYRDDDIIVFEKPYGISMHIGAGISDNTIVNALLHITKGKLSSLGGDTRPGIVHRLDKDTSGVMVAALTDKAYQKLTKQFSKHSIFRQYIALSWGIPSPLEGCIENKMARSKFNRQKMAITDGDNGKPAITNYKTKATYINGKVSQILCTLETGRTHQIRVHLSSTGNPIIGDKTYGKDPKFLQTISNEKAKHALSSVKRQMLHATALKFIHPITKKLMSFKSPLPDDMNELVKTLKNA
ncbi:MAG: RluA family pseudouridine synthase [Rickettsiales bacterium]|jgi:23S rRNA pseudouridine1911/1915/1917 synthase|nr:RluA family pseudouridine synthase [Rickettsiales bacterium]